MSRDRTLAMVTISCGGTDFPDAAYVVRRFEVGPERVIPGAVLGTADTLEQARALVPPLRRRQTAAIGHRRRPTVVETWV